MSDTELVDVVTTGDELTADKVTVPDAHEQSLPHRVAAVLILKPNGKMLVQVHKDHGRLMDHAVGGHVSSGEGYQVAAQREMYEELRLRVPITKVAEGVVSDEHYTQESLHIVHIFGVFVGQVDEDWSLVETEEVDSIIEVSIDEIVNQMNSEPEKFLQGFLASMGAYLSHIGSDRKIEAYGKVWGEL